MLMAAARVNIPTVVVSINLCCRKAARQNLDLTMMFEAVGSVRAGTMTEEEHIIWKTMPAPDVIVLGMFTANSMNCLTEALGMGLPGNGTIPAVYGERIVCKASWKVMEVLRNSCFPVI